MWYFYISVNFLYAWFERHSTCLATANERRPRSANLSMTRWTLDAISALLCASERICINKVRNTSFLDMQFQLSCVYVKKSS